MADKLDSVHQMAAEALDRLRDRFKDPVRVTLIVRNLADPTGERDVVITDDDLNGIDSAIAAVRSRLEQL